MRYDPIKVISLSAKIGESGETLKSIAEMPEIQVNPYQMPAAGKLVDAMKMTGMAIKEYGDMLKQVQSVIVDMMKNLSAADQAGGS